MLLHVWLLALAAGGGPPTLNVVGTCPDEPSVRHLLDQLLPGDEPGAATVGVYDRGSWYGLSVNGEPTTLSDPARDCAARARQAAIIAAAGIRSAHALVLGPPSWTVEKGFTFEIASGPAGGTLSAIGAEIRGAYGSGLWSVFGAAGARGPATSSLEHGWKVEMIRFPLDVGARLTVHGLRLRPWFGVGPSLTPTGFLGTELVRADRQWRLDPGAVAMAGATLPVSGRIGVCASLTVRWQPRRYNLDVEPFGSVAETPAWWFGLTANYVVDSRPTSP